MRVLSGWTVRNAGANGSEEKRRVPALTRVGQGGKTSLDNTVDADILEYILAKLAARIEAKSRAFLVKVKAHRGDPLNEGADDLAETGREMEKEGENSRW